MLVKTIAATAAIALIAVTAAVALGDKPPEGAKPLSEVIKSLEDQGYKPITDVELDDGKWEIEAYTKAGKRELKVDPVTGEILADRPDD